MKFVTQAPAPTPKEHVIQHQSAVAREGHPLEAVLVALESAAPCQWAVEQPSLTTILTSPTMVHLLHVVSRYVSAVQTYAS